MKITFFGARPEPAMAAEIVKNIPEDAQEVTVMSNARKPLGIRPCQHPGVLFADVSIDNKTFVHLRQDAVDAPITVKTT